MVCVCAKCAQYRFVRRRAGSRWLMETGGRLAYHIYTHSHGSTRSLCVAVPVVIIIAWALPPFHNVVLDNTSTAHLFIAPAQNVIIKEFLDRSIFLDSGMTVWQLNYQQLAKVVAGERQKKMDSKNGSTGDGLCSHIKILGKAHNTTEHNGRRSESTTTHTHCMPREEAKMCVCSRSINEK